MEEKNFIIGEQLAKALLQYLGSKPYVEVFQLVAALQGIPPEQKPEIKETYPEEDIA